MRFRPVSPLLLSNVTEDNPTFKKEHLNVAEIKRSSNESLDKY